MSALGNVILFMVSRFQVKFDCKNTRPAHVWNKNGMPFLCFFKNKNKIVYNTLQNASCRIRWHAAAPDKITTIGYCP